VGEYHPCGIGAGSSKVLKCWGRNNTSQLGTGGFGDTTKYTSVAVDAEGVYSSVSVSKRFHICGITLAGKLKCWGANDHYQLGDGIQDNSYGPRLIFFSLTAQQFEFC
jgi:large repetitive protein